MYTYTWCNVVECSLTFPPIIVLFVCIYRVLIAFFCLLSTFVLQPSLQSCFVTVCEIAMFRYIICCCSSPTWDRADKARAKCIATIWVKCFPHTQLPCIAFFFISFPIITIYTSHP